VGQEEAERGLRFARGRGRAAAGADSADPSAASGSVDDDSEELGEKYALSAAAKKSRSAEEAVAYARVHAWTEAGDAAFAALSKIGQLLSVGAFAAVVSELLHHDDPVVRRRSIAMFNSHVSAKVEQLSRAEAQLYLHLLEDLLPMVRDREESQETRQTALLAVEVLARNFAKDFPVAFRPALEAAAETVDASASRVGDELRAAACVCVQAMASNMGTMVIGHLGRVVPALLNAAERSLPGSDTNASEKAAASDSEDGDDAGRVLLLRCSLAAVSVLLEQFPQFMPAFIGRVLAVSCHPAVVSPPAGALDLAFGDALAGAIEAGSSGAGLQGRLLKDVRARRVLASTQRKLEGSMARRVPSRALLPALLTAIARSKSQTMAPVTLCGFLSAMSAALEHGRRVEINALAQKVSDTMLQLLDNRWQAAVDSPADRTKQSRESTFIDRQVGEALGALVLRVSDDRARAIVTQLLEWGNAPLDELNEACKKSGSSDKDQSLFASISRRTSMYTALSAIMRAG